MDTHGSMTAPAARKHVEAGYGTLPEVLGAQLLPTPAATDYKRDDHPADQRRKSPGITTVSVYFPTPRASSATGPSKHGTGGPDLQTAITEISNGANTPPLFDAGNEH